MPSNLAPEIIVTVQNPADPDQCDTTSGSLESEDYGNNNKSSKSILRSKSTKLNDTGGGSVDSPSTKDKMTFTTEKQKSKHHHRHNNNDQHRIHLTRKGSKSTITTAIDMVEGKPRLWVSPRKSASAVRVQVTLHRPLNWQVVSAASYSTGFIPTKVVKQSSSSSTATTVTHSHSLSQSESLSFSISPSSSILTAPKNCHSRSNFLQQHRKGKVRFTELPRSRLGKHIEKIENKGRTGDTVSKSLCFCQCAISGDVIVGENDFNDGASLSRSVSSRTHPSSLSTPSSSGAVLMTENVNEDHDEFLQCSSGGNVCSNAKQIMYRRKKSRSASSRRRASSHHSEDHHHRLDRGSSSSSDNEGNGMANMHFVILSSKYSLRTYHNM